MHPIRGGERVVEQVRLQVQAAQVCETQGSRLHPKTDETELRGKRKKKEPRITKRTREMEENRTHGGEELERQTGSMDRSAPHGNAAAWAETEGALDGGHRSADEQNRADGTERQQRRLPDERRGGTAEGNARKRRRQNEEPLRTALGGGSQGQVPQWGARASEGVKGAGCRSNSSSSSSSSSCCCSSSSSSRCSHLPLPPLPTTTTNAAPTRVRQYLIPYHIKYHNT